MIKHGKQVVYKLGHKTYHCAMDITMDYIGGKWKSVVLWYLIGGTLRFAELKQLMPDITEKMLSIQLKKLENSGLVKRDTFGVRPPFKVEYSLTDLGKTLVPALDAIATWGRERGRHMGGAV